MKVLHLTPHLGGGVGRALSGLSDAGDDIEHLFVCLEKAEKDFFIKQIQQAGHQVIVQPSTDELKNLITQSDIVQLEWWRHPATIACLTELSDVPMRLIVWCHVSGLFNEVIPIDLIKQSARFIFTSACSFQAQAITELSEDNQQKLSVINSNGGFDHWPYSPACEASVPISVGYIGSFNFSKLHPDYVSFLSKVPITGFHVTLIGEAFNAEQLQLEATHKNKTELLRFSGYTDDVAKSLSQINVLAYIQNPLHYGTNENALLEAMAMGIVPVVLDNPAECEIVEDGKTGIVVHDPESFAQAIASLAMDPKNRMKLGQQAAESVRKRHAIGKMSSLFHQQYVQAMQSYKRKVGFMDLFGEHAEDWFLSCQQDKTVFRDDGTVEPPQNNYAKYSLAEFTKGSVRHFHRYFPESKLLGKWAEQVTML